MAARAALVEAARAEAAKKRGSIFLAQGSDAIGLGDAALAYVTDVVSLEETLNTPTPEQQDAELFQLLIAVRAIAAGEKPAAEEAPSPTASRLRNDPAARLMRCIWQVIEERRRQFLHYRLQWLVFEKTKPRPQDFVLPESISSPRRVPALEVRQAWWATAREHADVLRKTDSRLHKKILGHAGHTSHPSSGSMKQDAWKEEAKTQSRESRASISHRRSSRKSFLGANETVGGASPSSPTMRRVSLFSLAELQREESQAKVTIKQTDHDSWKVLLKSGRVQGSRSKRIIQKEEVSKKNRRASQLQKVEQNSMAYLLRAGAGGDDRDESDGAGSDVGSALGDDSRRGSNAEKMASRLADFMAEGNMSRSGTKVVNTRTAAEAVPMLPSMAIAAWSPQAPLPSPAERPRAAAGPGALPAPSHGPQLALPLAYTSEGQQANRSGRSTTAGSGAARRSTSTSSGGRPSSVGSIPSGGRSMHVAAAAASQLMGHMPLGGRPHAAPAAGERLKPPEGQRQKRPSSSSSAPNITVSYHTCAEKAPGTAEETAKPAVQERRPAARQQEQLPPARQKIVDSRIDRIFDTLPGQIMRNYTKSKRKLHGMPCEVPPKAEPGQAGQIPRAEVFRPDASAIMGSKETSGYMGSVLGSPNSTQKSPKQSQLPRPQVAVEPGQGEAASGGGGGGGHSAQHAYLASSAANQRLPVFPVSLEAGKDGDEAPIDIRHMNLQDDEATALLEGLKGREAPFSALLLAGNPRLTDATYLPLLQLVCARSHASHVRPVRLDLSGAKGLGDRTLQMLAQELCGELQELRSLRMDGIAVAEANWPSLETSVAGLQKLEELSLSDMQIGRVSQRSAASVAETLLGLPVLKHLDLSNNFFGLEGCRALAESLKYHRNLERLDLSHNAGGFVAASLCGGGGGARVEASGPAPSSTTTTSLGTCGQSSGYFNPLSLICEGISQARALKVLRLANCQLNFDEDFLLEEAVMIKTGVSLEEMDVSGNPAQGSMGARCLLRLVVNQPKLRRLELCEIREALPSPTSVAYELGDPSASYELDLYYPQHRAMLRTLLRRCEQVGAKDEDCFKFGGDSLPLGRQALNAWRSSGCVPCSGRMAFTFTLPAPLKALEEVGNIDSIIADMDQARKLKVGLYSFVRVAELFRQLSDVEARRIFVGAMACDLMLKLCHVRYLSQLDTRLRIEVIDKLLPAVHKLDRMGGFDLVLNARSTSCDGAPQPIHIGRAASVGLLLFNPGCTNAHFALSLGAPADRRLLEMLIIVNEWEQSRAKALDHPDLSEFGGHENFRNTLLNGSKIVWRNSEFSMPPRGELTFDYCSPFHPPADAPLPCDGLLERITAAVESAVCDPLPKVAVLRSELHRLCLSPKQCARLITSFPDISNMKDLDGTGSMVPKSARTDAFVALYSRCTDIGGLVSAEDHGLYGLQILSREEVAMARRRLGKLRTWDLTRCDEEELCRWDQIMGPRSTDWRARKQEAEDDERKMQRTLQDYRLLDDPTSRGNANRYALDLAVPEERKLASILLKLAQKEPGDHFDDPYWSTKEKLFERGTRWLIPEDWNTNVPETGIFKVRYFVERGNCKDVAVRRALAAKYLGW